MGKVDLGMFVWKSSRNAHKIEQKTETQLANLTVLLFNSTVYSASAQIRAQPTLPLKP